jgi:hypothetical protein
MERLFGREWEAYRDAGPRWGLALRPYARSVEPDEARNGNQATRPETNQGSPAAGSGR